MKIFSWTVLSIVGLCFASLTSCESQTLAEKDLRVGSQILRCELAVNTEQREKGLMFRDSMDANHGMLFVFPDEQVRNFWMKNTRIPLSIAYINKQGVIKEILDMKPFSLAPVPSQHSVQYALEVNQGAFAKLGIVAGDHIELTGLPTATE